ncbi:hypothetical protein AGMMS49965_04010 [Bacteroidia bacterium]|nr:hypothetical protein AGMMS49965_04010 [Bacteroidia bacterium]
MIQRIQSVWLLVVFLIAIGMAHLFQHDNIVLFINAVTAALAVVAMLRYKDRQRQIKFCYAIMLLEAAAAGVLFLTTANNLTDEFVNGYRWILPALAPIVGLIFALLAMLAIKKDEKLVRSLDRLR